MSLISNKLFSLNRFTFGVCDDTLPYAHGMREEESKKLYKALDLSKIELVDFPADQYYREQTNKNQIVLHHTVSGQGVDGDINYWRSTQSRIATSVIIDWKGIIHQCFSTKYWGHHLGVKSSFLKSQGFIGNENRSLNEASVGIEIDAWGGLVQDNTTLGWHPAKWDKKKGKFVPNKRVMAIENVQEYPEGFRGFYGFEKYTSEQIETTAKLLIYLSEKYDIPLNYNEDMWDVSKDALDGKSGIWAHVSYRSDKSDIHPQPEMIEMLKSLK